MSRPYVFPDAKSAAQAVRSVPNLPAVFVPMSEANDLHAEISPLGWVYCGNEGPMAPGGPPHAHFAPPNAEVTRMDLPRMRIVERTGATMIGECELQMSCCDASDVVTQVIVMETRRPISACVSCTARQFETGEWVDASFWLSVGGAP